MARRTVGEYVGLRQHFEEVIGEGAFGRVYKGLNAMTGQTVAIKQLPLVGANSEKLETLQKEVNLLRKLRHPNIVKYIGWR